jgi:hypothetical protein
MRDLRCFSAGEWLRFVPFKYAFKLTRNDVGLAIYKMFRPKSLDNFLMETKRLENRSVALVVAFEQPWALDWLLRMAQRNLTDTAVLVFDNSRRATARLEIEGVCRNHGIPYLALPANPTRHVNRSHGMAMTWIFHNVVRAIKPRMFAFIDHDLIPVRKMELSERLGDQPFFGRLETSPWAWQLWAGYCLFDFSAVAGLPMNFLYDFSQKLDTGARNWSCLYRNHDRDKMRFASNGHVEVGDPEGGKSWSMQIVDDRWLHIGGISYNDNFRSRAQFCENLAHALDQGISWSQLCGNATPLSPESGGTT